MATINSIDNLFVEEIPADWFRTAHSEPQAWRLDLICYGFLHAFHIFWKSSSLCVSEIRTCQLVNFSCSFLIASPLVRWWWRATVWWPWLWMHPSVVPRSGNPVATLFVRDFCYHHQSLLLKLGTASNFRSIEMHSV